MSRTETATCRDCGWTGPVENTSELRDFWDRVLPGDIMPAGQCPQEGCAGLAMLDEDREPVVDLRPEMEALMLNLDRLHRNIYSGRLRAPVGTYIKHLADSARKALAAGSGTSVRRCSPSASRAAGAASGSTHGHAGTRTGSAGSCTRSARPPQSAPIATSSAPTR